MKHVLITGGAGGIGSQIVKTFVENGYFAYVIDTDTEKSSLLTQAYGEACAVIHLDVTDPAQLRAFAQGVGEDFTLDHIVTLAGRALPDEWKPFEQQTLEDVEGSVKLNLLGHLNVVHTFLPFLKKTEGDKSIVMISSVNAFAGFGLPVYSAAKSGLYGFMTGIVGELGKEGIRINTVSPGTVKTDATLAEPKDFDALLHTTALNRFAPASEVAQLVLHLCGDYVSVTGQNFVIDAGQTRKR